MQDQATAALVQGTPAAACGIAGSDDDEDELPHLIPPVMSRDKRAGVPTSVCYASACGAADMVVLDKSTADPKADCGVRAGLINQAGVTCYMNAALQVLFMTPEFRQIIYMISPDGLERRSVLCELQLLFMRLQSSSLPALSTMVCTLQCAICAYL